MSTRSSGPAGCPARGSAIRPSCHRTTVEPMAQPDTALDTVTANAAAVRAGDLTARAATEATLARIAERDATIGAFQVVRTEAALREADAVDQRTDRFSLPLAGVPIAIKDNVAVSGEPMRIGSAGAGPEPRPAAQ